MGGRQLKSKDGAALPVALAIMAVLLVLGLALTAMSASLTATVHRSRDMTQCRELAQTMSREIEREITGVPVFKSWEEQQEAERSGAYPLYFYLRYNAGQDSWPEYAPEDAPPEAVRTFELGTDEGRLDPAVADALTVRMYWQTADANGAEPTLLLTVAATCVIGKQEYTALSSYERAVSFYAETQPGLEDGSAAAARLNPDGNSVSRQECWRWIVSDAGQEGTA